MERTIRTLVTVGVLVLLAASVASAQNVYAAVRGGPGWTPATYDGRPGFEDPSEHKTGVTTSAAVGHAWPSGLRLEGEFSFLRSPVESDAGVPLGGSIKNYVPTINLGYDARLRQALKAYVAFGVGAARVNHNDEFVSSTGVKMQADEAGTAFSYQARAGIGYEINQRLAFSAGYRYVHIGSGDVLQGADQHRVNFDVIKNHSIEFGLALKF